MHTLIKFYIVGYVRSGEGRAIGIFVHGWHRACRSNVPVLRLRSNSGPRRTNPTSPSSWSRHDDCTRRWQVSHPPVGTEPPTVCHDTQTSCPRIIILTGNMKVSLKSGFGWPLWTEVLLCASSWPVLLTKESFTYVSGARFTDRFLFEKEQEFKTRAYI